MSGSDESLLLDRKISLSVSLFLEGFFFPKMLFEFNRRLRSRERRRFFHPLSSDTHSQIPTYMKPVFLKPLKNIIIINSLPRGSFSLCPPVFLSVSLRTMDADELLLF